jgi:hypothetical protein
LALTHRYEEAERVKEQADDQEESEAERLGEKERTAHSTRREKLLAAQKKDVQAFTDRAEAARQIMVTKRDQKIGGYLRRMNRINQELGNRLAVLEVDEADVCDQEPDIARAEFAYHEEMASPIRAFPHRVMAERTDRTGPARPPGLSPRHR